MSVKGLVGVMAVVLSSTAWGNVQLPAVIGSNMVLQQGTEAPLWGKAEAGEKLSVKASWLKTELSTSADPAGKWMLKLRTPKAGGPYKIEIKGNNTIVLENVMIGEVWFCGGQSNMEMPVSPWLPWFKGVVNYPQECAEANYPNIRLFKVMPASNSKVQDDCIGKWSQCDSNTVAQFSAAAYFFGRRLHKELNVPIGLIQSSFGGTPAESWTSIDTLESEFKDLLDRQHADAAKAEATYKKQLEQWEANKVKAASEGKAVPAEPAKPLCLMGQWQPSWLYNAMVAPVVPYGIKGAIWYQGESNADRAYQYRTLFPAMIKNWRDKWQEGQFPFYYVQISSFQQPFKEPVESDWAELMEAQLMAMSKVKNSGMAVSIDIGEANDIHPRNKQDVGGRLALWALNKTYGYHKLMCSGPIYRSMKIEGDKIRLFFDNVGDGLMVKGAQLYRFAIAGADRKFVWADAQIDGKTVVVHSAQMTEPVAVRYAWEINPEGCNLYNKAGLPASPFRTDDWQGVTYGRK